MNSNSPTSPPVTATAQPAATPASPPRFLFSLMFLVWFAVVLAATLVTLVLPESFCSTARIRVERDQTDVRGLSDQPPVPTYDPYFIQTEFEALQSELILGRVIDQLDLNTVWGKKYNDGQKLKTQESLTLLRGRLSLRPVRSTTLIDIQVYSESPVEAAKLANTIAESYRQFRLDRTQQLASEGLKALEAKLKELDAGIRSAQEELASLAEPVENPQLPDAKKLTYLEKKKNLEDLSDMRRLVKRRLTVGKLDLNLPRSAQVIIVEHAAPGLKPVRPNKPLNIFLSIFIGGFVGLLLAVLVYLLQRLAFRRKSGAGSTTNLRSLRTFLRVTIALVVGLIVGYNCAMPMSAASLFIMQLFVFLGGIAFAFVELAKPTPNLPSPTAPPQSQWKDLTRPE